ATTVPNGGAGGTTRHSPQGAPSAPATAPATGARRLPPSGPPDDGLAGGGPGGGARPGAPAPPGPPPPPPPPRLGPPPPSLAPPGGQPAPRVQSLARGAGYPLFLGTGGPPLALARPHAPNDAPAAGLLTDVLRMDLVGARRGVRGEGQGELLGKVNYLLGNDP